MRSFRCSCDNVLYFDNTRCVKCQREVGWCPVCRGIADVGALEGGGFCCTGCSAHLVKCVNFLKYNVCNRFVAVAESGGAGAGGAADAGGAGAGEECFCDCCRFNRTIPDLQVEGNLQKWGRLEAAKRRALYDLALLGMPYGDEKEGVTPGLAFEFKADVLPEERYRNMKGEEREKVFTGHSNGVITINVQEADDVVREKLRVDLHEAQRSLLGHFRHELGHYLWDVMVKGKREPECAAAFGDHANPAYADAMTAYYANGPQKEWLLQFVSAYATMHPWEDFAETFAVYLDMASALHTAFHNRLLPELNLANLDWMVLAYQRLGIALNEMNRSNGLLDYLPEVMAEGVREKLRFIHSLAAAGPYVKWSANTVRGVKRIGVCPPAHAGMPAFRRLVRSRNG